MRTYATYADVFLGVSHCVRSQDITRERAYRTTPLLISRFDGFRRAACSPSMGDLKGMKPTSAAVSDGGARTGPSGSSGRDGRVLHNADAERCAFCGGGGEDAKKGWQAAAEGAGAVL